MNYKKCLFYLLSIILIQNASAEVPDAPRLTLLVDGDFIRIDWVEVEGASGYTLYYAPYPDPDPISSLDLGAQQSISGTLANGLAFYVGATAYNDEGEGDFSNIESFEIWVDNLYYPPEGKLAVCSFIEPVDSIDVFCEEKDFADYGLGPLESFRVTSNTILVDAAVRRTELASLSEEDLNNWCAADIGPPVDYATYTSPPVTGLSDDNRSPISDMGNTLLFGRVHFEYLNQVDAGPMILRSLRGWADARTLMEVDFLTNPGVALDVKTNMFIYILAWNSIRDKEFVSDEDRSTIDFYMESLALKLTYIEGKEWGFDPDGGLDSFNHGWQQDLALMAYGVLTGNDRYFQRGIRRFFWILDGLIREDGSHFYESQRGGAALGYSINATNLLFRMAEIATNQGFNLYDIEIDGIGLHKIMEFHIAALEDNELIHQYTIYQNPSSCGPVQCENWDNQGFSYEHNGGFFAFADFEIYKRRFPSSELVARYDAMFPESTYTPVIEGPMIQTCEFRNTNLLL